jgi:hypothetical protein
LNSGEETVVKEWIIGREGKNEKVKTLNLKGKHY